MGAMRLTFDEIKSEIKRVLVKYGMSEEKAETCARIHTETTYDGVYSHGTNRVARFVNYIQKGWVDVNAEPSLEREFGALRVYNGNMGPGILNALYCADRAMDMIVTTEKDAVRLEKPEEDPEVPIYFLRIEVEIYQGREAWERCVDRICGISEPRPRDEWMPSSSF